MQHVFCEIMLRDVEYLLCRYLKKMRKSISRLHWDVDNNDGSNSPLSFDRVSMADPAPRISDAFF